MENQAAKRPMVLVVEPDALMLTAMAAVLHSAGFRSFLAKTHDVAVAACKTTSFDLIVASFEENQVLHVAQNVAQLRSYQQNADLPVIFVSSRLDVSWIEPLNKAGGVHCLTRPFEPEKLIELAEQACMFPHLAIARLAPPKAHFAHDWVRLT